MSASLPGRTILADAEATEALGDALAVELRPGDLVLLEGPLGAGKTTLVRGLVRALGGEPAEVCSPTFVLMESYAVSRGGIKRLHHADLYRLRGRLSAPWDELGLDEALDDSAAVTAVEWPEGWSWQASEAAHVLHVRLTFVQAGRAAELAWEL